MPNKYAVAEKGKKRKNNNKKSDLNEGKGRRIDLGRGRGGDACLGLEARKSERSSSSSVWINV